MRHLKTWGDTLLQRIDLGFWYKIGETIHPLTELFGVQKISDINFKLYFAKAEIEAMLPQMYSSHASAVEFIGVLDQFLNINDTNRELLAWETLLISRAATKFETAFKAELGTQPCYHVTPKGGYNVDILTLGAQALFPADLITLVPNLEYDIDQAGKCLAFEICSYSRQLPGSG